MWIVGVAVCGEIRREQLCRHTARNRCAVSGKSDGVAAAGAVCREQRRQRPTSCLSIVIILGSLLVGGGGSSMFFVFAALWCWRGLSNCSLGAGRGGKGIKR